MASTSPTPQLRLYQNWLEAHRGLRFETYQDLWHWSVTDLEAFWRSIWEYEAIESATPFESALCVDTMPGAVWFKGATVNYARHVFRHVEAAQAAGQPAIVSENELGEVRETSWRELQRQVASLALTLRGLGVGRGDRVAAYLSNDPEAVVAFLACASLGAIWSLCAPDMGAQAIIDRFSQIQPKVFIAVDGVHYAGKPSDRSAMVLRLQSALPTLLATVVLETPFASARVAGALKFVDATSRADPEVDAFQPEWLPFDHPLWVLYSSGTTGLPKPIVQGHGGVLLTSMASGKHIDLGSSYATETLGERFHWFTSTGWVMWNAQIGGLLGGTTICLYDGSPFGARENPDWSVLWRFASRHRVTFFGSGAAFFGNCMKATLNLGGCGNLSAIRALGSTGSPLTEDVQNWGTRQFNSLGTANIWWCNISGGTDLGGTFCTGNRELPQTPGEMQCRQIGAAVEAWNDAGRSVVNEVGELVCVRPIPAMPLYFWGDPEDRRYRSSYFDTYPGIWRHGDWIKITPSGSCIIYGRSDATINRHGVRMGTSEVYAAVESLDEVTDSLALDLEYLGRQSRLLLFVVLRPGLILDDALKAKICESIRRNLSPRFIPDEIIQAPEVPRTLSGKKQEVPLKKLFLGQPPEKIINREVMANPASIDWYLSHIRAQS
jgi:acetoacetyl-CoA synthetase